MKKSGTRRARRIAGWTLLGLGLAGLATVAVLLRLTVVTDYLYHHAVKDPERSAPTEPAIVSPADGTVLYVQRVEGGVIPEVTKLGVAVPIVDLLRADHLEPQDGWLIGIYMNTFGVHVNRIPNHGVLEEQIVFNGPHMDMTDAETKIILTGMIPGLTSLRRLLGRTAHGTDDVADFVLQSARETLVLRDERGVRLYITRIADYYVGKILTWIEEGSDVRRGQRLGMITWGSQTDLFIEDTPGLEITAEVGKYVYGGETILARY